MIKPGNLTNNLIMIIALLNLHFFSHSMEDGAPKTRFKIYNATDKEIFLSYLVTPPKSGPYNSPFWKALKVESRQTLESPLGHKIVNLQTSLENEQYITAEVSIPPNDSGKGENAINAHLKSTKYSPPEYVKSIAQITHPTKDLSLEYVIKIKAQGSHLEQSTLKASARNIQNTDESLYHSHHRLAQQLYLKGECKSCGSKDGNHSQCKIIRDAAHHDLLVLIDGMLASIAFYYSSFHYDGEDLKTIYKKTCNSLHPYTTKGFHDRYGAEQLKYQVERVGKKAFTDFLLKKKEFMDNQLVPGSIDYHTIYVALARKIHILGIAIDMLQGNLPYTHWNQSPEFIDCCVRINAETPQVQYTLQK